MGVIINGDIYIKIKPSIFNPTDEQIEKIENDIYDVEFEEADIGSTLNTSIIKNTLYNMKDLLSKKGQKDHSFMDDFHVIKTDGEKVTMKVYEENLEKEIVETFDLESEKISEYMRLIDFLNEAEFVGKKIKIYRDDSRLENPTIIYKTDYAICIQDEKLLGRKYIKMLDMRTSDKPLGEYDPTVEKYKDKNLLYQTIVKQIDEISKKCEKPNENDKRRKA